MGSLDGVIISLLLVDLFLRIQNSPDVIFVTLDISDTGQLVHVSQMMLADFVSPLLENVNACVFFREMRMEQKMKKCSGCGPTPYPPGLWVCAACSQSLVFSKFCGFPPQVL